MTGDRWPEPRTDLLTAPDGATLEHLRTGSGEPVTVFAHGLGNGIADTRPLGSGVPGTRIFFHFRGHGRSRAPGDRGAWTYADLAGDLAAVAAACGARRALGVSLGAAALCRLVAREPGRFERIVFFLPPVLDGPRPEASAARLTALHGDGDRDRLRATVAAEVPEPLRGTPAAGAYVRQRVGYLTRHPLAPALAGLLHDVAVPDAAALAEVRVPALVIGCDGDELHPAAAARQLARSLGNATLHVYGEPGVPWTARADLRTRIAGFLS